MITEAIMQKTCEHENRPGGIWAKRGLGLKLLFALSKAIYHVITFVREHGSLLLQEATSA